MPVFSAHDRIDLIYAVADQDRLFRVQCKTALLIGDVFYFRTCSNTANQPRDYVGQIDQFGVFSPDVGLVYLVPASEVPSRTCSLRLSATRNRQAARIRWARQYELGPP